MDLFTGGRNVSLCGFNRPSKLYYYVINQMILYRSVFRNEVSCIGPHSWSSCYDTLSKLWGLRNSQKLASHSVALINSSVYKHSYHAWIQRVLSEEVQI